MARRSARRANDIFRDLFAFMEDIIGFIAVGTSIIIYGHNHLLLSSLQYDARIEAKDSTN
jgi:hypothetical protein